MKTFSAIIIAVAIIIGSIVIAYAMSINGRYNIVQRENNRMTLLDTRTDQFWDINPSRIGGFVNKKD
jgi:uncharacterized protein YxeA